MTRREVRIFLSLRSYAMHLHLYDRFVVGAKDWPDTDRTSELRKKGFEGRRLGPKQMTTDTAVRVTRIIVQEQSESIPSIPRDANWYCDSSIR